MSSGISQTAKRKYLRGVILRLICTNHDEQQTHYSSGSLWSAAVRGLGCDCSRNELITTLQDLKGRGYVDFSFKKNDDDGSVRLFNIELCPKGRDLLEGTTEDPAVEL